MAYQIEATPVTLNDLDGYSPGAGLFKCNSSTIYAMQRFCKISNDVVRRAVPQRQLGFLLVFITSHIHLIIKKIYKVSEKLSAAEFDINIPII